MADINTYVAKNYELWGAGFGVLTYKGQVLDLISDFNDSGQPALGEPLDVMTINDQRPRTIIPPMAISSGTFTFTTYGLRDLGVWATVFNQKFKNAGDLVDIFNQQLEDGAMQISWITVDLSGVPSKVYTYDGVVIVNGQKNPHIDNRGAKQASYTFTCKYVRVQEQVKNQNKVGH